MVKRMKMEKKSYIKFLNDKFTEVMAEKEKEEKNKETLSQNEKKNSEKYPKDLNLREAVLMKETFKAMKKEVHDVITSHLLQTIPNYYLGSSSNVATKNHMLPFGFDSMNGYNDHSQIQNQVFDQAYPHYHHGPRFF